MLGEPHVYLTYGLEVALPEVDSVSVKPSGGVSLWLCDAPTLPDRRESTYVI